jgi:hypothetical protein
MGCCESKRKEELKDISKQNKQLIQDVKLYLNTIKFLLLSKKRTGLAMSTLLISRKMQDIYDDINEARSSCIDSVKGIQHPDEFDSSKNKLKTKLEREVILHESSIQLLYKVIEDLWKPGIENPDMYDYNEKLILDKSIQAQLRTMETDLSGALRDNLSRGDLIVKYNSNLPLSEEDKRIEYRIKEATEDKFDKAVRGWVYAIAAAPSTIKRIARSSRNSLP